MSFIALVITIIVISIVLEEIVWKRFDNPFDRVFRYVFDRTFRFIVDSVLYIADTKIGSRILYLTGNLLLIGSFVAVILLSLVAGYLLTGTNPIDLIGKF